MDTYTQEKPSFLSASSCLFIISSISASSIISSNSAGSFSLTVELEELFSAKEEVKE